MWKSVWITEAPLQPTSPLNFPPYLNPHPLDSSSFWVCVQFPLNGCSLARVQARTLLRWYYTRTFAMGDFLPRKYRHLMEAFSPWGILLSPRGLPYPAYRAPDENCLPGNPSRMLNNWFCIFSKIFRTFKCFQVLVLRVFQIICALTRIDPISRGSENQ